MGLDPLKKVLQSGGLSLPITYKVQNPRTPGDAGLDNTLLQCWKLAKTKRGKPNNRAYTRL